MEEFVCPFCNAKLELKSKYTKSGHLAKCKKFKEYKKNILTKEYLIDEYINKERSAIEIAQQHNLQSASSILKLCTLYNIKTRNISESKNEREKEKRYKTNLKKYGCHHNFCSIHPSRIQWEEKMFIEEGIVNVFQRQSVVDQITKKKYERGYIIPREYKTNKLEKYYADVWYHTGKNFNQFYNDINPNNYKRGRKTYHLDHKISILFGYLNDIDPEIIGHRCNLEMLYYKENIKKQANCSLSLNELLERIDELEKLNEDNEN